jgi:ADP-ribosylglycohydrolase
MSNLFSDKFIYSLYGVAIGDALGVPFEFDKTYVLNNDEKEKPFIDFQVFDEKSTKSVFLDKEIYIPFRFRTKTIQPATTSDDTGMMLCLLQAIDIDYNHKIAYYNKEKILTAYITWANGVGKGSLGRNTSFLLCGKNKKERTIEAYETRKASIAHEMNKKQSNGSLMRCLPLVLFERDMWDFDCSLTNDNDVNKECSFVYLTIAKYLILRFDYKIEYDKFRVDKLKCKCIKIAIDNAVKHKILKVNGRNIVFDEDSTVMEKGWVVTALYVALYTLLKATSFKHGLKIVFETFISQNDNYPDSDTILAITCGLLGARFGKYPLEPYKLLKTTFKTIDDILTP